MHPVNIVEDSQTVLFSDCAHYGPDSRPACVRTFVTDEEPLLLERAKRYARVLRYRDDHRLLDNYVDIEFEQFAIISLLEYDGQIVGFSTGWARDFYPEGSIRILNRFYQDNKHLRVDFSREIARPTMLHMVEQQLIMAHRLGFERAFISREMRAVKHFQRFIEALDRVSTHSWEYRKGPYLLAPDEMNDSCWQSIGVTDLCYTPKLFWQHWRTKYDHAF